MQRSAQTAAIWSTYSYSLAGIFYYVSNYGTTYEKMPARSYA
jgi:hypothetical protein